MKEKISEGAEVSRFGPLEKLVVSLQQGRVSRRENECSLWEATGPLGGGSEKRMAGKTTFDFRQITKPLRDPVS